jgi:DNA-binding Lrp family transcriptional regulator
MHELHAFVNIFVESSLIDEVVEALSKIDAVEEIYEVTGEFDIVSLWRLQISSHLGMS